MKNSRFTKGVAKLLCITTLAGAVAAPLVACGGDGNTGPTLILSSEALDGNFNPFFYTAGADGEIVSQTQIGMISSDSEGKPLVGWDEPCVAFDYSTVRVGNPDNVINGTDYSNYYTEYSFALKDNIKFSDGQPLTKDDVLFNIYMYLDPAYTGSSTLYSVKIMGLDEYRTQTEDVNNIDGSNAFFQTEVTRRLENIINWIENDEEGDWGQWDGYEMYEGEAVVQKDIEQIQTFFKQSLEETWTSVVSADIEKEYEKYKDKDGNVIITEAWQLFLLMYGQFTLQEEWVGSGSDAKIDHYTAINNYPANKKKDQATLIQHVYDSMFFEQKNATESYKQNLGNVLYSYPVNVYMNDYLLSDVKYRMFKDNMNVKKVSGIWIENDNKIEYTDDKLVKHTKSLKDKDGNVSNYDILHIKIKGVDPKAIQNFGFTVAPGHYYSDKETWKKAVDDTNDEEFFGVKFSDPNFMNMVKQKQLPMGAGPFMAATEKNTKASSKSDFYKSSKNIVNFISNPNFLLGEPLIKRLRYKVISSSQLYNAVKTGEVDYASPSMKKDDITEINNEKDLNYVMTDNLGYGYIGISARYIPNIYIRKAIMTTLNRESIINYYGNDGASTITVPMSKTLKKYYDVAEAYVKEQGIGDEYDFDPTGAKALELLTLGGCSPRGDVMRDEKNKPIKYTFTIAGDSDDHPAYAMLKQSAEILNKLGCDITVVNDSNALVKLTSGQLTVWAAAWSSSSDPDMFQVYHKDSQATSTTAWGYRYIFSSEFKELSAINNPRNYNQKKMIEELSDIIDEGRESLEEIVRQEVYARAQNKLLDLAVEFPTYQRKVFYIWKKGVFDESTMLTGSQVNAYQSPLSRIWEVKLTKSK